MKNDSFSSTCGSIYASVAAFFVLCILVVFPMYYHDYYFDILPSKYQFYYVSMIAMFAILLLLTIVFMVIDFLEFCGGHTKAVLKKMRPGEWKNTLTAADACLITFLVIGCISTMQSDYVYEAFWGNEGRYTGLFLHLLYGISFLLISRLYRPKRWHFQVFLAMAMLPLLFGITDYFKMDLLGFKTEIADSDRYLFTSTFGNINTYTTYTGLIFGCISALFVTERKRLASSLYYVGLVISMFAMIMGISDNAFLAFGIVFAMLPLFAFRSRESSRRFGVLFATFLTVCQVEAYLDSAWAGKVVPLEGVARVLTGFDYLWLLAGIAWAVVAALYLLEWLGEKNGKHGAGRTGGTRGDDLGSRYVIAWGIFLAAAFLATCFVVYDANIGGNGERYGSLGKYLVFSDEWGTYRGMIWRITMEAYGKLPLLQKIFGFGLDTFGVMVLDYRGETTEICGQVFDSAHNEYLQYFVTIGPLGFLAYMGFLGTALHGIVRKARDKKYGLAVFFGVLCYLVQGIVSINLPIVTPIMWMLLAVGTANRRIKEN